MFANLSSTSFIDYFDYPLFLIIVFVAGIVDYIKSRDSYKDNHIETIITLQASILLKTMSCTMIVLHHYALRYQDNAAEKFFAVNGGTIALVAFFFLSSYGICLSEKYHPLNFTYYFKKRFLKIIKPFWIVTFLFLLIYTLIDKHDIKVFEYGVSDYFMCFINITKFDGAMWFVEVILLSYLVFFIAKSIFSIDNKRIKFLITYTLGIICIGVFYFLLDYPAHYYRNLWSLVVGMVFALYGKYFVEHKWVIAVVCCCAFGYILIQSYMMEELWWYSMGCIYAITFILGGVFLSFYNVFAGSVVRVLGSASYFVYLIHEKVFSLLDIFWGKMPVFIPLMIVLSCSVCINWVYLRVNNGGSAYLTK